MKQESKLELYFREPLISMGFVPRVIVRVLVNIFTTVFIIITAAFLISPVQSFFWTGCLFLLVLLDKLFHSAVPSKKISDLPSKGRVNLAKYLSPHTRRAIIMAHENSKITKGSFILHLCSYLLEDEEVKEPIKRLDVNVEELEDKLNSYIQNSTVVSKEPEIQVSIEEAMILALEVAFSGNADFIGCGDLFVAITKLNDKDLKRLLDIFDISSDDLAKALIFGRVNRISIFKSLPRTIGGFATRRLRKRVVNRAWTSRPTPILNKFSFDYSATARRGEAAIMIGHGSEYERLLNILSSAAKPNALLVGEAGIGRGVVVSYLAYMISIDKVPPALFDKRLVSLDINNLLAGADQAELEIRIQKIFNEIEAAGNIILHIPDIHNLARTGGTSQITAANAIIPLITSSSFPLIGTTYPKEYKQYIEADSAFANAFTVIKFEEVSLDDALKIMIYKGIILERQYGVKVGYNALKTAVQIAKKYFAVSPLPGSAADLLKEALAYATRHGRKRLTSDDIISVAESRVNIPIRRAGKDEAEKLLDLESLIHERLVGQADAVNAVSEALREYRSGLGRKGGPIGTFLFVGPTGVGKTELSKILAKIQFGREDAMIRFDMSEYQDKQSVFQFIGSPDGRMAGLLTDRVLEKPYSLILLDEFEKAHPDILNLFLQVFDDGRLTDNFGRVVSFENTIIIATSNANSLFVKQELEKGRSVKDISVDLKKKLGSYFRPELLNRFSSIVVFRDLTREDIRSIRSLNLKSLADTVNESQGVELTFSDDAITKIAELGFDPVFGARPLRGVISEQIKNPLSKMILSGSLPRGSKVSVELIDNEISLRISE